MFKESVAMALLTVAKIWYLRLLLSATIKLITVLEKNKKKLLNTKLLPTLSLAASTPVKPLLLSAES